MDKSFEIDLITGSFTPLETSKVLFPLINSKIHYHNLEVFSAQIKEQGDVAHSKKRLQYLNDAADNVDKIIKEAVSQNKKFQIETKIVLKLIDN